MAIEKKDWRPKRDTRNPCAICGWSEHMAIHLPTTSGPNKGRHVGIGHPYQPVKTKQREGQQ